MGRDDTIMVVVAHSDDQILGPGGAMAKYAKEGKHIITIICSYGEGSHPHFKKEVITEIRAKEAKKADKIIGGDGVIFFGASDGKIKDDIEQLGLKESLSKLFLDYKPGKIFTHANDEALPDHLAVNKLVLDVYDTLHEQKKLVSDIFTFGVWRIFKLKKRKNPRLIVDISDTFKIKLKALAVFKSQKIALFTLKWTVYAKALLHGFKNAVRFAEEFYKVR